MLPRPPPKPDGASRRGGAPTSSGPPVTPAAAKPGQSRAVPRVVPAAADPVETGAGLSLLLRVEALAREAADLTELGHLIANETRKLNRARQIFVVEVKSGGRPGIVAVSGASVADPQSLLVDAVRRLIERTGRETGLNAPADFTLPAYCEPQSELATAYPFREMSWQPYLDRRKRVFGGMLMARDSVWGKDDAAISSRLALAYAHAWRELATAKAFGAERAWRRSWKPLALVGLAALALPLPVTALAPVEIVARDPMIVAAPIDGVIDSIAVDPGMAVNAGDVLVRLSDTALRNRASVARQEVIVAEEKAKQAAIRAINDVQGRHELGLAQAEFELKKAEFAFASDVLDRSVIRAGRSGLAVYSGKASWAGRPVATGERIMEIADPDHVEARIDLAVPDAIALKPDSRVQIFLDVDPLHPWSGEVVRSDYRARPSDSDVLSFKTIARIDEDGRPKPRIGLRGTAKVAGDRVPLLLYLLRRPISAARQWIGL